MNLKPLHLLLALLLALGACSTKGAEQTFDHSAHEVDGEECGACAMIVREQSAPRGQVLHRDGTRHFFCSVSDMLAWLEAPSPHGEAVGQWVEVLNPEADPADFDSAPKPWAPADQVTYVIGVPKPRVMGQPILTYRARVLADARAKQHEGARVLDYETLRAQHLTRKNP